MPLEVADRIVRSKVRWGYRGIIAVKSIGRFPNELLHRELAAFDDDAPFSNVAGHEVFGRVGDRFPGQCLKSRVSQEMPPLLSLLLHLLSIQMSLRQRFSCSTRRIRRRARDPCERVVQQADAPMGVEPVNARFLSKRGPPRRPRMLRGFAEARTNLIRR